MDKLDFLHPGLIETSHAAGLESLGALYGRLAREQAASLAAVSSHGPELACPAGCGSCCEGFVPDILPVEAAYLAAWPEGMPAAPPCPFHEAGREGGKCGVYPARPLVCRLFGFSSVRDREGRDSFALCRRMPARRGGRAWSGADLLRELGGGLPSMVDYGSLACAIAPGEAGERALLTEALPSALRRLALTLTLARRASADDDDDPDNDRPNPTVPRAA